MIRAEQFLQQAHQRGFDFFTGVPCSFLTPLINRVISDQRTAYIGATSEGEAVGIAAGAWLAGCNTIVMCQNSGLGNMVNPITSLNHPFKIPTLLIVTWRGEPGINDEPQHKVMGSITPSLLEAIGVAHCPFPRQEHEIAPALDLALSHMEKTGLPFAFVMEKGSVETEALTVSASKPQRCGELRDHTSRGSPLHRAQALTGLLESIPQAAAVVATTGKTGRELFTLADRPQHLYQVGSMGCASAMGLGIALNSSRPVVVIDGDGATLMKLGNLATIGANAPQRLVHLLLDNGVHDSTGGQPTAATNVDFVGTAITCGYAVAHRCDTLEGLIKALDSAFIETGPQFIHMQIAPGSMEPLGRPDSAPEAIAQRMREFLAVPQQNDRVSS